MKDIDTALSTISKARVSFNFKKFSFFTDNLKYLGNLIKPSALTIGEACVKSLDKLQHPGM